MKGQGSPLGDTAYPRGVNFSVFSYFERNAKMQELTAPTSRPSAVSIVVLIFILSTILAILNLAVMLYQEGVLGVPDPFGALQAALQTEQGLIRLALIVIEMTMIAIIVVATIGLYRLQRWAWTLAMLLLGIGLALNLMRYLRGDPVYVLMIVRVIAVILLDQEPVRFAFGQKVAEHV